MPEWPDVEIFKQYLDATSLHQKIRTLTVLNRKVLEGTSSKKLSQALQGHSFESTNRHGKYLFVKSDNNAVLFLHFGMTGSLRYSKNDREDGPHDRVVFTFKNNYKLVYVCQRLLGRVGLAESIDRFVEKHELGPDALSLDLKDFRQIFEKGRSNVKSTMMNQKLIAGIGNIYSDEILFQAKVHPAMACSKLSDADVKNIHHNMKKVLKRAVERKADPEKLPKSYLLVHRDKDGTCPRCHGRIQTRKISGRTSYFCPKCQRRRRNR